MSDYLCSKFHISITSQHLPEKSDKPVATVKVLPTIRKSTNSGLRGVSNDVLDISMGIQGVSMGRGRGRGLAKIRQPSSGRGMS